VWDLWWIKWHWGRFSPTTSVSPANHHSTNCSTILADVPSGLSLTTLKIIIIIIIIQVKDRKPADVPPKRQQSSTLLFGVTYRFGSSELLLALASTVILGLGHRWNTWSNCCSFQDHLWVWKWGLLFDERRVCLSEYAPRLLHRNFADLYPHSRRDQVRAFVFYGHRTRFVTLVQRITFMRDIRMTPVNIGLCISKRQLVILTIVDLTTSYSTRRHIPENNTLHNHHVTTSNPT
jgi:hypothetical protein